MSRLVNILTRTSGRPNYFTENARSVKKQTYPHVRHIVCADDEESYEYAKDKVSDIIRVERKPRREEYGWRHSPYNLYCNKLMEEVTEGWVMFLDDDEIFLNKNSLVNIMEHAQDEDDLLIWKIQFPRAVIPGPAFGKGVFPCQIDANCYMFHSKHIWAAQWDEVKESDYRVANKLSSFLNIKWIDRVLTKVNNSKVFHGPGGGLGMREDKVL